MNSSFFMVSRLTSTIAFPAALAVVLFKEELIKIFHSSFTHNSTFMILLLVSPLLSCTVGLAGNILVMTGNSLWNLINSILAFGLNALTNYLLVPRFGLMGAAGATALSSIVISSVQLIEVYLIIGAKILISKIYKPYIAISSSIATVAIMSWFFASGGIVLKSLMLITSLVLYGVVLYLLKLEPEDKSLFFSKFHKK